MKTRQQRIEAHRLATTAVPQPGERWAAVILATPEHPINVPGEVIIAEHRPGVALPPGTTPCLAWPGLDVEYYAGCVTLGRLGQFKRSDIEVGELWCVVSQDFTQEAVAVTGALKEAMVTMLDWTGCQYAEIPYDHFLWPIVQPIDTIEPGDVMPYPPRGESGVKLLRHLVPTLSEERARELTAIARNESVLVTCDALRGFIARHAPERT